MMRAAASEVWRKVSKHCVLAGVVCLGFWFGLGAQGCTTADAGGPSDTTRIDKVNDPYPVTVSDKLFPFEARTQNFYRFVEFDSAGGNTFTNEAATQKFWLLQNQHYGWSLDGDSNGVLLARRQGGVVESVGVYLAGSFVDDSLDRQQEQLWFPEFPKNWIDKSWRVGNREMTVVSADTGLWLPMKENARNYVREVETGRYRVPVAIFREVNGEVITEYAFSHGIGLVLFQRRKKGVLTSSGLLNESYSLFFGRKMWP